MKTRAKSKTHASLSQPPAGYFHGTSALAAVCIAVDGFRIVDTSLRNWFDGALGDGIYITSSLSMASSYARGFVIRAQLAPGTRVLRLDERYDPRVIDSLRREFGAGILRLEFEKSISSNKQLRNAEIVHLCNYLWAKGVLGKKRGLFPFSDSVGPLRRYLAKFQYAALGCPDSDIGIVVFNPSRLIATRIDRMGDKTTRQEDPLAQRETGEELPQADPLELASTAAQTLHGFARVAEALRTSLANEKADGSRWIIESDRNELTALLSEYPRWQACLRRYCERFHLSTNSPELAAALSKTL